MRSAADRLILALGAGWHEPEYRAFGFPFDHRYSRFEEAFTIIHSLLRTGQVDFEGTYYSARECELRPRGPRGNAPDHDGHDRRKMLRLTRHAEQWNVWLAMGRSAPEEVPAQTAWSTPPAAMSAATRHSGGTVSIMVDLTGGSKIPASMGPDSAVPVTGTPEELAEELRAYAREGVSPRAGLAGTDDPGQHRVVPAGAGIAGPWITTNASNETACQGAARWVR